MVARRRWTALGFASALTFSACAGSSESSVDSVVTEEPASTPDASGDATFDEAPSEPEPEPVEADEDASPDEADAPDVSAEPDEAVTDDGSSPDDVAADQGQPDADTGPAAAELGGRSFAEALDGSKQFDGDPFPDLVVDDVGRETKANLANVLPSDRPVLLWTWAPH